MSDLLAGDWDRRKILRGIGAGVAYGALNRSARRLPALESTAPRFRIAACDWSLGRTADVAALELAREIGLDGVQVSFGDPEAKHDLRREEIRRQYEDAAKRTGVVVASLGMGVLNSVPLATDKRAEKWVADCIDVMPKLGQKIVLLAFFGQGDILNEPEQQAAVIASLRRLAPRAERAGVTLGIESWLNAEQHRRIIDAVGSAAVRVYYDMANMDTKGYDVAADLRQLNRELVCEIHCKENGNLLGQGRVDFPRIKRILDEWDWRGWLVIEGAVPSGMSLVEAYKRNREYLRRVFFAE
jgi:sugar phosphate isomerase/epimerase